VLVQTASGDTARGKRGRDVSLRASGLSIWTLDGRLKPVPFHGPPGLEDKLNNWTFGDGCLFVCAKSKTVFLTLSFKKEAEKRVAPNDAVISVDRGINVIACATDGRRNWMRRGGHTKHARNRYLHTRSSLQKKKAEQPTRSKSKLLKRLSGREKRFMQAVNHGVSKSIITFALKAGYPVIAVEQLDCIRDRKPRKAQRAEIHRWAYGQLDFFLRYKAESSGMSVIEVDLRGTSKGYSCCGHTEPANRKRHVFKCRACGHMLHDDVNAAHNIRLRGILAWQALGQDGPLSCGPEVRPADPGSNPGEGADKPPAVAGGT
jgi:IS605 OrfB family transposase